MTSGDFGIEGYAYGDNVSTLHANGTDNGDDKDNGEAGVMTVNVSIFHANGNGNGDDNEKG